MVQTEAPDGSHSGSIPDPATDADTAQARIASELLRYRDQNGDDWADIIDMLTMHPEERRKAVRLLGEIQADA